MTLGYENLYQFQKEDVDKLEDQRSRLIGSEMGTGKTPTALILDLVNRREIRKNNPDVKLKTLVVTLSGAMVDAWDKHAMEWTEEDVYVLNPKNRPRFIRQVLHPASSGFFVMHWDALRLMPELRRIKWFHIIADECQKMKNPKAQMTRAMKKLPAMYRTGASGTAADNKPMDLWSTINWLHPRIYTSYWNLYERLLDYHMHESGTYRIIDGFKSEEVLQEFLDEMKPWYVRRLKKDVLTDLPDKYYTTYYVDLGPKQRAAYEQMRKSMVAWVHQQMEDGVNLEMPLVAQNVISRLIRLQQFAVGYMQYVETIKVWDKKTEEWIDKDIFKMTEPSAKLDAAIEILESMGNQSLIVFSKYKQSINLLAKRLEKLGYPYGTITGDVKQTDRGAVVESFQKGNIQVIAGTIAAGGAGITLTKSSTVLFLDKAWSPAQNKQAEDRAHRISQTEAVQIISLIAKDTVDLGQERKLFLKWKNIQMILGDIPWEDLREDKDK